MTSPFPYGPFTGATLVSAFAAGWVAAGARSLPRRWPLTLFVSALAISAAVLWRDYGLLRRGMHLPKSFDGAAYGAAVMFEAVAIPVAVTLLNRFGKAAYILPAIALIVGVHFFGLVWAFDSPACWWIGGAICVLSISTIAWVPSHSRRKADGGETKLWDVVIGVGCALILWFAVATEF
jgi:hypothetical protein